MHTQTGIHGGVNCPVSRRVEGTMRNAGEKCSFCCQKVSKKA